MKTTNPTPEEIARYTAKFADLKPSSQDFLQREGIPVEAYEMVSAKKILPVAASVREEKGGNSRAPIDIPPGVSVWIVETPPGNGPPLHAHMETRETFMCLKGRYEVFYGPNGENSVILEPMDTVSMPTGVLRNFVNTSDDTSYLLVLIHEEEDKLALNDIYMKPELGREIASKFGDDILRKMENIGSQFTADI